MEKILNIEKMHLCYGRLSVLKGLSFSVAKGAIVCIVGESGCGKTSLLKSIAGLLPICSGNIYWKGAAWAEGWQLVPSQKRGIGFVFQDYALFPHLNARENVNFALHRWPRPKRKKRIDECLELFGIEDLGKRYPHQLSGGQQQRLALARSLAPEPELMLLDEPLVHLSSEARYHTQKQLRSIFKYQKTTVLFSSHHEEEMELLADQSMSLAEPLNEAKNIKYLAQDNLMYNV